MSHANKYYLETSSIRKVGGKLQQVGAIGDCRTSAFVLFELLTGLMESDKQFNYRKAAIAAVLDSGIEIAWSLPTSRLKRAFQKLQYQWDDESILRPIIACVRQSRSRQHFAELINERQLMHSLEELEREDADMAKGLQVVLQRPSLRHEVAAFVEEHMPGATEEERSEICGRIVSLMLPYWVASPHAVVKAMAYKCAKDCISEPSDDELDAVAASYDRSLPLFMRTFSHAISTCWDRKLMPGKNDLADLLHLVYLRDGDVLVSEEGERKAAMRVIRDMGIPVQCIASL